MTGAAAHDADGCLFCWMAEGGEEADAERLVLHRAHHNLVVINRYPYNNGHLMIAPYAHVADLVSADEPQLRELMSLARACQEVMQRVYRPDGFNLGMNLGSAGGAGVPGHHHLHVLPRWEGDTNFMSTTGDTRIIPEEPKRTYERLRPEFDTLTG